MTAKLWKVGVRHFKGLSACRVYHFETKSTHRVCRNDGHTQFLLKWGFPNSVLRKQLTRLGEDFTPEPPETESEKPIGSRFKYRLKAAWALLTGRQFGPLDRF